MSKSLGNFFTVRELLDQGVPGEVIRFVMLSTHYRKPMDWTEKAKSDAISTLQQWYEIAQNATDSRTPDSLLDFLADDLNTSGAISVLHGFATMDEASSLAGGLKFLGLMGEFIPEWAQKRVVTDEVSTLVERLLRIRSQARADKDFILSDKIRDGFVNAGIEVKDEGGQTVWEIKRGIMDTYPFHANFRDACNSGDEGKISEARKIALEAGINFNSDIENPNAWVGRPEDTFVLKTLKNIERHL